MEVIGEKNERALGDVKDLTRYFRDRTEDMERINIRDMETSSDLKGERFYLLGKLLLGRLARKRGW